MENWRLGVGGSATHVRRTWNRREAARARCSTGAAKRGTSRADLRLLRQVEFALFDMQLHTDYVPGEPASIAALGQVRAREVSVLLRPDYDRFMHAFGHVFAGGYAAGYYSYKWAEVLSADAFSLFEEVGVLARQPGPGSATRSSPRAAAGRRSNRSSPSGAGLPAGRPFAP